MLSAINSLEDGLACHLSSSSLPLTLRIPVKVQGMSRYSVATTSRTVVGGVFPRVHSPSSSCLALLIVLVFH